MALDPNEPLPPPLPHEREAMRKAEEELAQKEAERAAKKKSLVQKRPKAKDRTPPPKKDREAAPGPALGKGPATPPAVAETDPAAAARRLEILTPGEKFGDYQILKCLSYDLLGSLYRVRKARERTERTLLVLPPALSDSTEFAERFQSNRERLISLAHPDILSPKETLQIKGRLALVCEGVTAVNLADFFETEGSEIKGTKVFALAASDVKGVLERVVSTLQYAHGQGIQHHNLNPANILRTPEGRVLISGFGLADILGPDEFRTAANAALPPLLLDPGQVRVGTQDVQPPEAKRGDTLSETADFYAVGVLAYWMLTGRKPDRDGTPPSTLRPEIAPGWDLIVAKCLEPSPKKRYQDATQILEDLERIDHLKVAGGKQAVAALDSGLWAGINKHLSFIPLPLVITQQGQKTSGMIRLGGLAACLALVFGAMSAVVSLATQTEEEAPRVIRRAGNDLEPNWRLEVTPGLFQVIPPSDSAFVVQGNNVDLRVAEGAHEIVLRKPGYRDETVQLRGTGRLQTRSITLQEAFAPLRIETKPGALVAAIDEEGEPIPVGVADAEGVLVADEALKEGTYTLVATLENHRDHRLDAANLTGDNNQFEMPLEPLPGTLRVRSEPQGAIIELDGERIGVTNFTVDELRANEEFVLTLRKPGYLPESRAVSLEPGVRTWLDYGELEVATFQVVPEITINGEEPSAADLAEASLMVTSDNPAAPGEFSTSLAPSDPDLAKLDAVPAGNVTLRLEHPRWTPFERSFEATPKSRVRLRADLSLRPATITLDIQPAGLPVTLLLPDGSRMALGDQRQFAIAARRAQQLRLSAPGHLDVVRDINPEPGEELTLDIRFRPFPPPQPGENYAVPGLPLLLAWIPVERFSMGSPPEENSRLPVEGPRTVVDFSQGYWMGVHEVTQALYERVMGSNPSRAGSSDRHPVDSVTYEQARAFCERLTEREASAGRLPEGYEYRLPTEAEWEYAARGGTTTPFHWGETATPAKGAFVGRYPRELGGEITAETVGPGSSVPVGSFDPNAYGLYDVHGNMAEWTLDYYNSRLPGGFERDWVQRTPSSRHPLRGGSWRSFAKDARAAVREDNLVPTATREDVGFRAALAPVIEL
ncbi:MAG: SUMF1/EgtB/PvdO family nonheme iron enzyme [Opitutales bacterium]